MALTPEQCLGRLRVLYRDAHKTPAASDACGFVFPPPARRELVTVDGTLQELTARDAARQRRNVVGRARTREELEAIRLERGYSRGWTDHILRARGAARA